MKYENEVISLFEQFGFKHRKSSSCEFFLVFTYQAGFFHNAEIVSFDTTNRESIEKEILPVSSDLEKVGYSVKTAFYSSIEELEKKLFEGFFDVNNWKDKIHSEYEQHCDRVLKSLPVKVDRYSYVKAPYTKNGRYSSNNIIDEVMRSLSKNGPQLTIIEAPAGFGKTCTSYEIVNELIKDNDLPIPFFTEFSRDRQARIFSHIFIREVDRSFTSVNSDNVIAQVKKGRITIVLDGFDELLHDNSTKNDNSENEESVEPMLETISELLVGNAKIILTSRRSAIFDGEMFSEWIEKYEEKFTINRFRLETPKINDWLNGERLDRLQNAKVEVEKLANPVLLSFLRFITDETFNELIEDPTKIVNQYLDAMLSREMDRQGLPMSPEQQTKFLSIIASEMCEHNFTSISKESMVKLIIEKVGDLLSDVRKLYPPKDRPSLDKLSTTLSNHAFFDRSNQGDNNIEFINEFIFGNYIAENIINTPEWMANDERFVEPAIISYIPRNNECRQKLWGNLSTMLQFLEPATRYRFESYLTGNIGNKDWSDVEVFSITVKDSTFFPNNQLVNSIFANCTFVNCTFYVKNLSEITFLDSTFWECEFIDYEKFHNNIDFFHCLGDPSDEITEDVVLQSESKKDRIDRFILERIWPVGADYLERKHFFTKNLLRGYEESGFTRKEILKEIRNLRKEGILEEANDSNFIGINMNKMSEIRDILGRN